jgi:hypothetical protein
MSAIAVFSAEQFSDTPYVGGSAADKAKAANQLLAFLRAGCPQHLFSERIYRALSQHSFGHIAEFSRHGFYATWFSSPQARSAWWRYVARGGAYGFHDPERTDLWGDVERALVAEIEGSGLGDELIEAGAAATEAEERAELARLQDKYPTANSADGGPGEDGIDGPARVRPRSVDEAAKALGLRSYDTALPQDWVDEFEARTETSPLGHFVWSYDGAGIFGRPVALDLEAERLLADFELLPSLDASSLPDAPPPGPLTRRLLGKLEFAHANKGECERCRRKQVDLTQVNGQWLGTDCAARARSESRGATVAAPTAVGGDALRQRLVRKLRPERFSAMSGRMAAIVGFLVGEKLAAPAISELVVTSDGWVLAQHAGEVGAEHFVGSEADLERNLAALRRAAQLDQDEAAELERRQRAKIRRFGRPGG